MARELNVSPALRVGVELEPEPALHRRARVAAGEAVGEATKKRSKKRIA